MARTISSATVLNTFVFLLPIGAVAIEHWLSVFFVLVAAFALALIHRNLQVLNRPEKCIVAAAALVYLSFIVTTVVNGWSKELEVQVRFFLLIPLLLLFKRHPQSAVWLLRGTLVAIVPATLQAFYDVQLNAMHRANGAYGPLFIGSLASIFALMALWEAMRPLYSFIKRALLFVLFLMAAYVVFVSVSRAGVLILIFGVVALVMISHFSQRKKVASIALLFVLTTLSYVAFDRVQYEVQRPFVEVEKFRSIDDPRYFDGRLKSGGQRLTWWKTSLLIINEHPLAGIGMFSFDEYAEKYVEAGKVTPVASMASHSHNMFLEMWVSRGLYGLTSLSLLLFAALWLYIRNYRFAPHVTTFGLVHLGGVVMFGLFESAPVVKGNYVAFFVIYLAAFAAWSQFTSKTSAQQNGDVA